MEDTTGPVCRSRNFIGSFKAVDLADTVGLSEGNAVTEDLFPFLLY